MEMIRSKKHLPEKEYIKIFENHYALRKEWFSMTEKERHLDICNCFVKHRESLMFTGESACAARGIAKLNGFKTRPHCISEKTKGSDTIYWHKGLLDPNATIVKGLLVASPARAVFDLRKTDDAKSILVSVNHCLYNKLFSKEKLLLEIEKHEGARWKNSLKGLLKLASEKCESPLETIAWAEIYSAGFVLPQQQVEISNNGFLVGRVDMYWEFGGRKIVLELDGQEKYDNRQVLILEKSREDQLRAIGYEVIRASWNDVIKGELIQKLKISRIPGRRYTKQAIRFK